MIINILAHNQNDCISDEGMRGNRVLFVDNVTTLAMSRGTSDKQIDSMTFQRNF